jgi:hypothetical protein
MDAVETEMRKQIAQDGDCIAAGTRLLAMRKELAVMIEEFTALGGPVRLPSVDERLKQSYRPLPKGRVRERSWRAGNARCGFRIAPPSNKSA